MKYTFEAEEAEYQSSIIRVSVEYKGEDGEDRSGLLLSDTYQDPYFIYYGETLRLHITDEDEFENELFDYLKQKYPSRF